MAFSGLQIGWGLWRIAEIDTLMFCSWYVAAMVGSIISTYLLNQWTKKNIYVSDCGKTFAIYQNFF